MKLLIVQFSPISCHFTPSLVQIFSSTPCSQTPEVTHEPVGTFHMCLCQAANTQFVSMETRQ
jgi:hypothetical protein